MVDKKEKKCIDCIIDPSIKEDLEKLNSKNKAKKKKTKEEHTIKKEVKQNMTKKKEENRNKEKEAKEKEKVLIKVEIDFTEYEELYKKLLEKSKQDFRTPELEILWIINEFFKTSQS